MAEYNSGAYFIKRKNSGRGHGGAILVLVLLVLTAAIVLLAIFLPRKKEGGGQVSLPISETKLYYLVTGETNEYTTALLMVQECASRGGAGYLFNDGTYHAVAAVYGKESDVRDLAAVNDGARYFSLGFSGAALGKFDSSALSYALGEFNDTLFTAATELDRKSMSDAAADNAVAAACRKLKALSMSVENAPLARAFDIASEYDPNADNRTLLTYIRFVHVRATIEIYYALTV